MRPGIPGMILWAGICAAQAMGQNAPGPGKWDPFNDIHPDAKAVDVPSRIHVRDPADVARVRKELIAFIWKNKGILPTGAEVDRQKENLPRELQGCRATAEKWLVRMPGGFQSVVHFYQPTRPAKRLALFHQGHDNLWTGGAEDTVAMLLEKGFAVLVFQMPLYGENRKLAPPEITSHDAMAKLASAEWEPVRYFVEPVTVCLNQALKSGGYGDVVMTGLSGGGWTTTLVAAIDPRVRLSIPVAGSLPDYLRLATPARDSGDWEQYHPSLYRIANYLDWYILGASGPGRKQLQVLNQFDSCCFAGVGFRTYESHVRQAVSGTGAGAFEVFLDKTHRSHRISRHALLEAIAPLLDAMPPSPASP